jgi:hypothetical protein
MSAVCSTRRFLSRYLAGRPRRVSMRRRLRLLLSDITCPDEFEKWRARMRMVFSGHRGMADISGAEIHNLARGQDTPQDHILSNDTAPVALSLVLEVKPDSIRSKVESDYHHLLKVTERPVRYHNKCLNMHWETVNNIQCFHASRNRC